MPSDLEADRALSERARRGDPAAWRTIYETTCDRLFALLCYQVGDRDEARDILQETYLQAFRRIGAYRAEAPLAVWLRTIALGRAIDWKRVILRRLKRTARLEDATASVEPDLHAVRFDAEDDALHQALAALSDRQRAALLLREWDGLSFHDIAGTIGCAESTARVHHARAREHMRNALRGTRHALLRADWEGLGT